MKILNPENLTRFVAAIGDTPDKQLFVVSDFDRTLTKAYVNGHYVPSLMGILRNSGSLGEEYKIKGQELFNYYSPKVEGDNALPLAERGELVLQWWTKAYELLKNSGLRKEHIEELIKHPDLQLRDGVAEFLNWTEKCTIPVFIMSAAGLGITGIESFLENIGQLRKNIHIISNNLLWSEEGLFLGIKEPMVHMFNKTGELLFGSPEASTSLGNRRIAIVLGDNIGDSKMSDGISDISLKVYVKGSEETLENQNISEYFDVVLEADESFEEIMKSIEVTY